MSFIPFFWNTSFTDATAFLIRVSGEFLGPSGLPEASNALRFLLYSRMYRFMSLITPSQPSISRSISLTSNASCS